MREDLVSEPRVESCAILLRLLLLLETSGEPDRTGLLPGGKFSLTTELEEGAFREEKTAIDLIDETDVSCRSCEVGDVSRRNVRPDPVERAGSTGSKVTMRGFGSGSARTSTISWNLTLRSHVVVVLSDVGRVMVEERR